MVAGLFGRSDFHYRVSVLLAVILTILTSTMSDNNIAKFAQRLDTFANSLYENIRPNKAQSNVFVSPLSIQTCVAMLRVGAEKETSSELDVWLSTGTADRQRLAEGFNRALACYEDSKILRIANRIYVDETCAIRAATNKLLKDAFLAEAVNVDFRNNAQAALRINDWISQRTNGLIKDLISPATLDSKTKLVVVNTVHFKGNWKYQFSRDATELGHFHSSNTISIQTPMMSLKRRLRFVELADVDAAALEMPYANSNLSMLVILPNKRNGLERLLGGLKTTSIKQIRAQLNDAEVIVKLPRFKIEFEAELNEPLMKLGIQRMFTDKADFGPLLEDGSVPVKVSKVLHKTLIEVNEEGTEAAAATAAVVRLKRSLDFSEPIEFIADHPFVFFITNDESLNIFMGTLTNPLNASKPPHDEL